MPFTYARWLGDSTVDEKGINWHFNGVLRAKDRREHSVCLFSSQWILDPFIEKNSGLAPSEIGYRNRVFKPGCPDERFRGVSIRELAGITMERYDLYEVHALVRRIVLDLDLRVEASRCENVGT